ncbi:MAG: hypothetical protein PHI19_03390 [Clostridia bacterium]|nr:hypothetical protein [Clostridia bacterium]
MFNAGASAAPISFAPPSSTITLSPGTYLITFIASYDTQSPALFGILVNGVLAQANTYLNRENSTQIYGQTVLTLATASTISLYNSTGEAVNLVTTLNGASPNAVSASMIIVKLA